MRTNNLKDLLKKLVLLDNDNPTALIEEIRSELSKMQPARTISLHRAPVKAVRKVRRAEDEYVYDIGMKNEAQPWFFGNNILLHNSVYFSAYPVLKTDIDAGLIPWTKESIIDLYDQIANAVNDSFEEFMRVAFHCPKTRAEVIRAGREIVAVSGLFITKKRYAVLVYDEENKRKDVDGKPGKVKAMGLDLKRSDTPVFMQEYLMDILLMVLKGESEQSILDSIKTFRTDFKLRPGYEKGSPKRANNIAHYEREEKKRGKATLPGHVRASINWNTLKKMHGDQYSLDIVDGMKVIVCKIKNNPLGFTSVAFPTDEPRLPEWFKELPFDDAAMEEVIIDNKLDNLIGVLEYDLNSTKEQAVFSKFFKWT